LKFLRNIYITIVVTRGDNSVAVWRPRP